MRNKQVGDYSGALPQLSVFLLPHIAQFCFQQLSVTFSVHSTFYHFEPAVSSLYKTIACLLYTSDAADE